MEEKTLLKMYKYGSTLPHVGLKLELILLEQRNSQYSQQKEIQTSLEENDLSTHQM